MAMGLVKFCPPPIHDGFDKFDCSGGEDDNGDGGGNDDVGCSPPVHDRREVVQRHLLLLLLRTHRQFHDQHRLDEEGGILGSFGNVLNCLSKNVAIFKSTLERSLHPLVLSLLPLQKAPLPRTAV